MSTPPVDSTTPEATVRGPVTVTAGASCATRPLALTDVRITRGFWADRQRVNREVSIPIGSTRLREAGNLENLELAAQQAAETQRLAGVEAYHGPVFMDSDAYKWREAVSGECAREPSSELSG